MALGNAIGLCLISLLLLSASLALIVNLLYPFFPPVRELAPDPDLSWYLEELKAAGLDRTASDGKAGLRNER